MPFTPPTRVQRPRHESTGNASLLVVVNSAGSFTDTSVVDETVLVALQHFKFPYRIHDLASGPLTTGLLSECAAVVLAQGSVVRSIIMVLVGLILGFVGTDITTGQSRFMFGIPQLSEGISFVALAMGLFGVGEVIANLARTFGKPEVQPVTSLWPNREEARRATPAVLRGTAIGSILGVLPGGGALIASFGAYVIEKKWSKRPEEFGNGGVCARRLRRARRHIEDAVERDHDVDFARLLRVASVTFKPRFFVSRSKHSGKMSTC